MNTAIRAFLVGIAFVDSGACCLGEGVSSKKAEVVAEIAKAKRDLARKIYEDIVRTERIVGSEGDVAKDVVSSEERYKWSKNWLEGDLELATSHETKLTAYQAHLDRMRKLVDDYNDFKKKRTGKDPMPGQEEYFRLEADLWLAKEKAR